MINTVNDEPCYCCGRRNLYVKKLPVNRLVCRDCGLIREWQTNIAAGRQSRIDYYENVDPHVEIANSKAVYFRNILNEIFGSRPSRSKRILDIGCGFGYFLEIAQNGGWDAYGVDISPKAVDEANLRLGKENVFCGDVSQAGYADGYFNVVTMWDVLDMLPDPKDAFSEIYRILSDDGVLCIRVRNATGQTLLFHINRLLGRVFESMGVKKLYIFHKYSFTLNALESLLNHYDFKILTAGNAPFTEGDPYGHFKRSEILSSFKQVAALFSHAVFLMSNRRLAINPSILVIADKS